jgi:signal transduction histidine kinase
MNPARPEHLSACGEANARLRALLRNRLQAMGVVPAPEAGAAGIRRVREADALLAQFVRAARHTSGSVRAFSSLIADAHEDDGDTIHWLARVERAAAELDVFSSRMTALRLNDRERPVLSKWADVFSRVTAHCGYIAPCTIEAIDRSRAPFLQRAELLGRMLFQVVRNAMEASPRGGTVRVRVDEFRHDGLRLFHVRVSDEGPGLDEAVAASAWEPYVTSRPGHAGLGLALVAAAAPVVGAVPGIRREGCRTTAHILVGEEGGLKWE